MCSEVGSKHGIIAKRALMLNVVDLDTLFCWHYLNLRKTTMQENVAKLTKRYKLNLLLAPTEE